MSDQASLLQSARQRDPAALAIIYDTYASKIYAYIYRHVGDAQRAEDLTANVFLKMLESLNRGKFARQSLQSWLYRIAHNLVVDDYRRNSRRPTASLHEGLALPPETDPDHLVGQRLQNESLLAALEHLTDDQHQVIILRFGEGLTAPQVGKIMGKTEEAVRALQRRALANLRRLLATPAVRENRL